MTAIAPVTDKTDHALRTIEGIEDAYSYHVSTFTTWLRERARPLDSEDMSYVLRRLIERWLEERKQREEAKNG